jgi:hypothetical protein
VVRVKTIGSGSIDFYSLTLWENWVHDRFVKNFFRKFLDLFDTHEDVVADFFLSDLLRSLFVVNFFQVAYLFFVSLCTISMVMLNLANLVPVRKDDLVLWIL